MYTSLALLLPRSLSSSLACLHFRRFQSLHQTQLNALHKRRDRLVSRSSNIVWCLKEDGGGGEQQQRRIERENKDRLNERQQSSSQWLHLVGDDWIGKLGIIRSQPKGVHCAIACRKGVGPVAPPVASQQLFHQKPFQPKAKAEKENL
jgi:hypothetical protein